MPFSGETQGPADPLDTGDREGILNSMSEYAYGQPDMQAFLENQVTNSWATMRCCTGGFASTCVRVLGTCSRV